MTNISLKLVFKLIAIIALLPIPATAGPIETSEWLLREPASVFDIGLLRLEVNLLVETPVFEDAYRQGAKATDAPRMTFDVRANQKAPNVAVIVRVFTETSNDDSVQAGCNAILDAIEDHAMNHFAEYFGHSGFESFNQPNNIDLVLLENMFTSCVVGTASEPDQYAVTKVFGFDPIGPISLPRDSE